MKKIIRKNMAIVLTALLIVMHMPFNISAATTVDFALNKTVTYSGVEKKENGDPYTQFKGENVVDGNPATRWSAEQQDIQWLIVDLESSKNIDTLEIRFFREPVDYTIEVSEDGINYETLLTVSNNDTINVENVRNFSFESTKAIQYIKIDQTKMFVNSGNNKLYGVSISQIHAYGEFDTSELQFAIDQAEKITDLDNYSESTKNEFLEAFINAKEVLETATSQEQIEDAKNRLLEAMNNLKATVDSSELEAEVNFPLAADDYTAKSYSAYEQAIAEGKELLESGNASQDQINSMVDKIKKAKEDLVEKIKEDELEQLINEVEDLNASDYTPDSWASLQDQLAAAKDALLNASNQQELDDAKEALQTAKDQLVANQIELTNRTLVSEDGLVSVTGIMHSDVVLVVEKHETHENLLERINDRKIFDTYGVVDAYDIYLLRANERYDFVGEMEVKIKMKSSLDHSTMKLIYISNSGDTEWIDSKVEYGSIVFKTTHFSDYAIVSKLATGASTSPETKDLVANSVNTKVDTSDSTNVAIISFMLLASATILVVLKKKYKE